MTHWPGTTHIAGYNTYEVGLVQSRGSRDSDSFGLCHDGSAAVPRKNRRVYPRCKPSTCRAEGSRLLRNPFVMARLRSGQAKLLEEARLEAQDVLRRIGDVIGSKRARSRALKLCSAT